MPASSRSSTDSAVTSMLRASRRWSSSPPRPPVPTPSTRAPYGHWLGASHLSAASCIDQLPAQSRGQEELHWTWDPEKDRINLQRHRISFQYWRFEETGEFHGACLAGDRLADGRYEPVPIETVKEGVLQWYSSELNLQIRLDQLSKGVAGPPTLPVPRRAAKTKCARPLCMLE